MMEAAEFAQRLGEHHGRLGGTGKLLEEQQPINRFRLSKVH